MAELRAQGRGPKFTPIVSEGVRYRGDHVEEYGERNVFASRARSLVAADDDLPPGGGLISSVLDAEICSKV